MATNAIERTSSLTRWTLLALGMTILCYVANAFLGALNQDEGWYLYAARKVMSGALPHRDFCYTQGLVMPIVYAGLGWLWSVAGILGGRLVTIAFSLAALCIADRTLLSCGTRLEERKLMRLAFFSMLGINLWYTYFTCIPKTYGLCTLGIAIGLRLLTGWNEKQRIDVACAAVAGGVFALITDVRLSMGILIPTIAVWLFLQRNWVGKWVWFAFLTTASLTLALLFLPELLFWPEAFWETYTFHAKREAMGLVGILGSIARIIRFNPLLVFLSILIAWLQFSKKPALRATTELRGKYQQLWLVCAAAFGVAHLIAPVPYDDYFVPMMLPLAMAIAFAFARLPFDSMRIAMGKCLVMAAVALTICASPIAQDWVILGKDRFWVQRKPAPDLFILWEAARTLRAEAKRLNEDTLWTQDTYLAVEAGLKVPTGLEMGPFSKPVSTTMPKLAAWSGYTFALRYPELSVNPEQSQQLDALRQIYGRQLFQMPVFGQGGTTLTVAERTLP